jgi:hypothetical protein
MADEAVKNVLIVDPGPNCEYAVYAMTEDEFLKVFPAVGQNIEFIEDVESRLGEAGLISLFKDVWERRVHKSEADGIHGTLFFQMEYKRPFYPTKNDEQMKAVIGGGPLNRWHHLSDDDHSF